ncbi:hypothetical protein SUDANB121_03653 [Nocardiopsis dassonvillei]
MKCRAACGGSRSDGASVRTPHPPLSGATAESSTVTRSPPSGRGTRVRVPSCARVTLLTMASPRPTPAWSVWMRSVPRRKGSVRVATTCGPSRWTDGRDRNAQALAEVLAAEADERVVLLGDLNGSTDDRALSGITALLDPAQELAGDGFGFSRPARFPVVRIDQVLVRGVEVEGSWVLPATGSDHLPVGAGISW